MPKDVTIKQLRYFIAAARSGRLSIAATDEQVSQSTVTTAIQTLETQVGVRLFDRHPYGVSLTPEGHLFHRRATEIIDSLDDALSEPELHRQTLRGTVRIAASYTVLGYFLPELLARFRRRYPDIVLDLIDMDRPQIESAIRIGDVEIGVAIISNSEAQSTLQRHVLVKSRRQLWTSAEHPLREKSAPTLSDVASYPYLLLDIDEGERSTLAYWDAHALKPDIAFRTRSMEALRGLVAHGFGVSILSDMIYRPWSLEGKKIEALTLADSIPSMEVGLLWHPRAALARPANAFKDFMIHAASSA